VAGSRPRARRRYHWAGAALGALALASPLTIAAVPAAAQGIQFGPVSGDGSGDLSLTVSSGAPLTDWTLSLSNGTNSYTMDDFTEFVDQDTFAADQPQTFVLPTADALGVFGAAGIALPPGSYTVTATAASDGVDTFTSPQTLTGSFDFLAQPTLAFSSSTFNTTEPNQSVTINGQITGCSTVACPSSWSNTMVTLTDVTPTSKPQWTGSATDSSGDFSVSGVTGVPGDSYSASVSAVPGASLSATTPSDTVDLPQYAQTLIMASAATAPYGEQTINGTLTYQSGLQQVAVPAGVTITATAGRHTLTTTTRSGGAFNLAVPPITGTTTWLLSTQNDLATTPFLASTQSSVGGTQLWPTATKFSATVSPYPPGGALLSVSGCVTTTISPPPSGSSDLPVDLQWKGSKRGSWKTFGQLTTHRQAGCAGLYFNGQGSPPGLSAYYRAYFPAGPVYAASTSASTGRVWIYQTRFDPFAATPHSVAAGKKIKVSGTLQYHGSKWRGLANQRVFVIFSYNRKNWFVIERRVRTNSKGEFSLSIADVYGTAYWSANYQGNKTHLEVSAPTPRVRVHGQASGKPSAATPPTGVRQVSTFPYPSWNRADTSLAWPYLLSADPLLLLMGD
jgi:hypothetical protein